MPLFINSQAESLRSTRALNQSTNKVSTALRKISSGLRVERAADDAAGLSQAVLAESQIRAYRQSIRNLNDGLSLSQTLEGALGEINTNLQRLRELSIQASTGSYNLADRQTLQDEVDQLIQEIDKIADHTKFNHINLLDGTASDLQIFVDQGEGATSLKVDLVRVDTHNIVQKASHSSESKGVDLGALNDGDVIINGHKIRGTVDADDLLSTKNASGSAIAKAKVINAYSAQTGVTARAEKNVVTGTSAISAQLLDEQSFFTINNVRIGGVDVQDNDRSGVLIDAINAVKDETGVRAQVTAQGKLQLIADDGRNIHVTYNSGQAFDSLGLTSNSGGGAANFAGGLGFNGLVSKSSVQPNAGGVGDIQAGDLKGQAQIVTAETNFDSYTGVVSVGGEFNRAQDYIDYVIEFVSDGGFGTAQFKLARDAQSETSPTEAYEFIQGQILPNTQENTTGVYFVNSDVHALGTFTGPVDQSFTLRVVKAGSADGVFPAEVQVFDSSGVAVGATFTVAANTDQTIYTHPTTGEEIKVRFDPSVRTSSNQESEVAGQGYTGNVSFGGVYNGDVTKTKDIIITETGYTQGTNEAVAELTETDADGALTIIGSFTIQGGFAHDIGDGLTVTFEPQSPSIVINSTVSGSYNEPVVSSDPDLYVLEDPATYLIKVKEAGTTDVAKVDIFKDGVLTTASTILTSGSFSIGDQIELNFGASPSQGSDTVGATTASTVGGAGIPYQSYDTVSITGDYDGSLGDQTVVLRVKQGGLVVDDASKQGSAAQLEYSFDNGANFTGTVFAVTGTNAVDHGVEIEFVDPSGGTNILSNPIYTSSITGNTITYAAEQMTNGTVDIYINPELFPTNSPLNGREFDVVLIPLASAGAEYISSGNQFSQIALELRDSTTNDKIINIPNQGLRYDTDLVYLTSDSGEPAITVRFNKDFDGKPQITSGNAGSVYLSVTDPNYDYAVVSGDARPDFTDNRPADTRNQGLIKMEFISASTITFSANNGHGTPITTSYNIPATGLIDLGASTLTQNKNTLFRTDPSFDIQVDLSQVVVGATFTLELFGNLLRLPRFGDQEIKTASVIDTEGLVEGDTFSAELITGVLEVGDTFEVDVSAPVLEQGSSYSIVQNVGRMELGDEVVVTAQSAFDNTIYTVGASNPLIDGLSLDFSTDGSFKAGDRVAIQARGYRGDFRVTGDYTDPGNPTTLEVKVKTTGDVDGGATLTVTRLDTGAIVADDVPAVSDLDEDTGVGELALGVFMEFQKTLGPSEAHRLYQGDTFYVDVTGLLNHTYGGKLTLESNKAIDLAYSDVSIDQQLGRMLYVGDEADVNGVTPAGSLERGVLGVNTELSVSKLDLTTQESANFAVRIIDAALEVISSARAESGAFQNRVTHELENLSETLFQTQRYQSRIQDADMAAETARFARSQIVQSAGVEVLRQVNQAGLLGLELLRGLTS